MTESMVMPFDSVFKVCKAFYNLSTTDLDEIGVVIRNTTGDKKVRMRALCLCPHWEYALIKSQRRADGEIPIKNKRQVASSWT